MLEREIRDLAALMGRLREADTDFRVFGADNHRYQIGPTLSEQQLQEFEAKHKILLPEDYRLYLKLIGNGSGRSLPPEPNASWMVAGAGPDYGLYSA